MKSLALSGCAMVLLFLDAGRFSVKAQALGAAVKTCAAGQLSVALDDENGNFNGMSHSGTLLVLRNLGPDTCSVAARPETGFEDTERQRLPISVEIPVGVKMGMHPGPVLLPVAVPLGAELTSELRWTSGDVFDGHNCITPAFLTVTLGAEMQRVEFKRQICGPAGKPVSYSMTLLRRDPAYPSAVVDSVTH